MPVVTAKQMLTWLDGRNGSTFGAVPRTTTGITFTIAQATGATGLYAMLPVQGTAGPLTGLTRGGTAVGGSGDLMSRGRFAKGQSGRGSSGGGSFRLSFAGTAGVAGAAGAEAPGEARRAAGAVQGPAGGRARRAEELGRARRTGLPRAGAGGGDTHLLDAGLGGLVVAGREHVGHELGHRRRVERGDGRRIGRSRTRPGRPHHGDPPGDEALGEHPRRVGGGVGGGGEDGGDEALDFVFVVEVEEPVGEADVAPHDSFAGLFGEAADDGGDGVADAHDGGVHFEAEEAGAADVGAEGFVGEPEVGAPDDLWLHVVGELVEEHFLADVHLAAVLGADQDFQGRLSGDGGDGRAERGMIVLFHLLVSRVLALGVGVEGGVADLPVGRESQTRDAAEELAFFECVLAKERGRGGVVAHVGDGALGGIARGVGHSHDVLRPESIDGDSRHQAGIDATRDADDYGLEAVLVDVVPGAGDQCLIDLRVALQGCRQRIVGKRGPVCRRRFLRDLHAGDLSRGQAQGLQPAQRAPQAGEVE